MELDYTLTKKQEAQLAALHAIAGERYSWLLQRIQGTGLRFWRITLSDEPEWAGVHRTVDEKTLAQVVASAANVMKGWMES